MADEGTRQGDDESQEERPQPEIRMELVGSLPGGRVIAGVQQEGSFTLLASKEHVSEQARDELVELFQRIVREGWWPQDWPDAN
ncbi:hypothetical protein [Streptomyces caniscabiei]|jgi:hypothetical protein|uniref:hypothetical protein n=1 Tax=Streptomyces caniscabiei TaxID=2746961 RepID=UPI00187290EA|nr:hypothetical protein [Streptomyces caniscabiei]MBE4796196.1 hypothetical protein [Streptomyces caniscabiei]MDX2944504.1 hypothetical protein [Streptomyces caniscabiei]